MRQAAEKWQSLFDAMASNAAVARSEALRLQDIAQQRRQGLEAAKEGKLPGAEEVAAMMGRCSATHCVINETWDETSHCLCYSSITDLLGHNTGIKMLQ